MLKIGEFSILSSISIFMLRHYDEIGLLKPGFVDTATGYRYYSEEQLLDANRIQAFKAMGFGLKEIIDVQMQGVKTESFQKLLENKAEEKTNEIKQLTRQVGMIMRSLEEFNNQEEFTCCITVKTIPQRKAVRHRAVIREFPEEGILWSVLTEECRKQNVQFAYPEYAMAIEHVVDFENNYFEIEVQRSVDKLYPNTDKVTFIEAAPQLVASTTYKGGYLRLNDINPYVAKWILANNYEICGPIHNIYHISPEREQREENYITEVCFPIKIRN